MLSRLGSMIDWLVGMDFSSKKTVWVEGGDLTHRETDLDDEVW